MSALQADSYTRSNPSGGVGMSLSRSQRRRVPLAEVANLLCSLVCGSCAQRDLVRRMGSNRPPMSLSKTNLEDGRKRL